MKKVLKFIAAISILSPFYAIGQLKTTQVDELFTDWDKSNTPGAAVAIIENGKMVYSNGYGIANLEYKIPITSNTVFHVASLSKQFTVFAILLLEEEGELSLDDDIRKYIPEVPQFDKKITLQHLASHTSGLREQWRLLEMGGWRLDDVITTDHIMGLVQNQQELNFSPGERFMYCNTGFTLLAKVVEKVSGKSFASFANQRIFQPLGMNNSFFYDDHERIVENRAYSYQTDDDGKIKKSNLNFATVGPTSLFTTVNDMSLWALNFQSKTIGSEEIFRKMNKPTTLNDGTSDTWALGQFVWKHEGIDIISHSGSDAGYRTYFARFPEENFAVIVFTNSSSNNANDKAFQIMDIYLGDRYEVSAENNSEPKLFEPDPSKFISLTTTELKQFEGKY